MWSGCCLFSSFFLLAFSRGRSFPLFFLAFGDLYFPLAVGLDLLLLRPRAFFGCLSGRLRLGSHLVPPARAGELWRGLVDGATFEQCERRPGWRARSVCRPAEAPMHAPINAALRGVKGEIGAMSLPPRLQSPGPIRVRCTRVCRFTSCRGGRCLSCWGHDGRRPRRASRSVVLCWKLLKGAAYALSARFWRGEIFSKIASTAARLPDTCPRIERRAI